MKRFFFSVLLFTSAAFCADFAKSPFDLPGANPEYVNQFLDRTGFTNEGWVFDKRLDRVNYAAVREALIFQFGEEIQRLSLDAGNPKSGFKKREESLMKRFRKAKEDLSKEIFPGDSKYEATVLKAAERCISAIEEFERAVARHVPSDRNFSEIVIARRKILAAMAVPAMFSAYNRLQAEKITIPPPIRDATADPLWHPTLTWAIPRFGATFALVFVGASMGSPYHYLLPGAAFGAGMLVVHLEQRIAKKKYFENERVREHRTDNLVAFQSRATRVWDQFFERIGSVFPSMRLLDDAGLIALSEGARCSFWLE